MKFCINTQLLHGNCISRRLALYRDLPHSTPIKNHIRNAMKVSTVLVLTAIVASASVTAIPAAIYGGLIEGVDGQIINLADVDTDGGLSASGDLSPIRHRRVTCDLLSVSTPWVTVNHAACAARCLAQRHKGGSCRDGVCNCRD